MQMIVDVQFKPEQHEREKAIEAALRRVGFAVMPLIIENQRDGQHWQHRRAIARKVAA